MEIIQRLRIRHNLPDEEKIHFAQINDQYQFLSVTAQRDDYVAQILDLLHESLAVNQIEFIKNLFFEFHKSIKKTDRNRNRIFETIGGLTTFKDSIDEQIQLTNIYRSIVADLFDPYISLIVALIKYKEGTYSTFLEANLGSGERNKYEFTLSRLNPSQLFSGYNPVVRNAISHTGTDGISYDGNTIVFRNIKRGTNPIVETVVWTTEELYKNIVALMDFIHSIHIAVNIFGIDIGDIIRSDAELNRRFIADILTVKERLEIQSHFDKIITTILASDKPDEEKKKDITTFFFYECVKRNIPVTSVKFNQDDKIALIEIPNGNFDLQEDAVLLSRLMELIRYAIIAEPCYRRIIKTFWIQETTEAHKDSLAVQLQGDLLYDYVLENAGLIDLIHEGTVLLNGKSIRIEVDFEYLKKLEYKSLDTIYPRKNRM